MRRRPARRRTQRERLAAAVARAVDREEAVLDRLAEEEHYAEGWERNYENLSRRVDVAREGLARVRVLLRTDPDAVPAAVAHVLGVLAGGHKPLPVDGGAS